jgi:hypothetical protein
MLEQLEPLAEAGRLSMWEIEFCADMIGKEEGTFSSQQKNKIEEIYKEHINERS